MLFTSRKVDKLGIVAEMRKSLNWIPLPLMSLANFLLSCMFNDANKKFKL